MASDEMFHSALRSKGDLSGVFEYDGETGYFYLYQTGEQGNKVLAANHILSGQADFEDNDLDVRWDATDERVALFIRGVLWALFDAKSGAKSGGNYRAGGVPELPLSITTGFEPLF